MSEQTASVDPVYDWLSAVRRGLRIERWLMPTGLALYGVLYLAQLLANHFIAEALAVNQQVTAMMQELGPRPKPDAPPGAAEAVDRKARIAELNSTMDRLETLYFRARLVADTVMGIALGSIILVVCMVRSIFLLSRPIGPDESRRLKRARISMRWTAMGLLIVSALRQFMVLVKFEPPGGADLFGFLLTVGAGLLRNGHEVVLIAAAECLGDDWLIRRTHQVLRQMYLGLLGIFALGLLFAVLGFPAVMKSVFITLIYLVAAYVLGNYYRLLRTFDRKLAEAEESFV